MDEIAEARKLLELMVGEYFGIRQDYYAKIQQAVADYMNAPDDSRVTSFQNAVRRAMTEAFPGAFETGIQDGGGGLPLDANDDAWLTSKMNAEFGYIGVTFQNLKQLKMTDDPQAIQDESYNVADRYSITLDGVYNEGKVRGMGNKMLTMGGNDGKESCATCQKYKGQRHKASWWVQHNLIPGQPGNTNYVCGGWVCEHYLMDDDGNLVTL
jgi:hypothetical protein